jgi:tripartite-type tricarboxylate transporter receptor subunit TctC
MFFKRLARLILRRLPILGDAMNPRQLAIAFLLVTFAVSRPAQAQDWPARAVTIVVPFSAGGADIVLRGLGKFLSDKFGQPFIVENRPGAGGGVGSDYVAKSAPDGYTVLLTAIGPAILNQLLSKSIPYDTDKDFTPIILFGELPQLIVSSPSLGFKSLGELVAYGRANPGKLNIGHSGAGSMGHLIGALFLSRTGIQGTLVSYRGVGPMVIDLLSGVIQAGVPVYIPQVKNVTILAIAGAQRVAFLPGVPTAHESGVDVSASTWFAIMGPAGMSPGVVAKLNEAINQFLTSSEGAQACLVGGIRPIGGKPEHLSTTIRQDRALWAPVIAKEKITLDPL